MIEVEEEMMVTRREIMPKKPSTDMNNKKKESLMLTFLINKYHKKSTLKGSIRMENPKSKLRNNNFGLMNLRMMSRTLKKRKNKNT